MQTKNFCRLPSIAARDRETWKKCQRCLHDLKKSYETKQNWQLVLRFYFAVIPCWRRCGRSRSSSPASADPTQGSQTFKPVFRFRIRLDPFHFGQPDPYPLQRIGSGSGWQKKSAKIMEIFHKINQNHQNIIHFFKTIKFMFTDINIQYLPYK